MEIDSGTLRASTDAAEFTALLLSASLGVFEAESRGLQDIDTENSLRSLWTSLLLGRGGTGAQDIVEFVKSFHLTLPG